jgi:DNA helicase-2/ATP-dependent DNA helicase PcrA
LSFKRLVEMLPGIGGRGAEKLWRMFRESTEAPASGDGSRIVRGLEACRPGVPRKAVGAWEQFLATAGQVEGRREDPGGMIRIVVDAGYREHLQETFTNYRNRLEDLEQLAVFARQFKTVEDFLAQLALLTNVEAEDQQTRAGEDDRVRLSTVHQAKGLEFDVVFVIMLCDGLFPSARSMESEEGEEEERRLFYVALTRARNELCLTYPLMRFTHGKDGDLIQQRSRFLGEIPPELLDEWTTRTFSPYG